MIFFKLSTFLEIPNNKKNYFNLFRVPSRAPNILVSFQHFSVTLPIFAECHTFSHRTFVHALSLSCSTVPSLFYFLIKIISRSVSVLACRSRLGILLRSEGKTENDVEWWCAGRSPRVERRLQRGKKKKKREKLTNNRAFFSIEFFYQEEIHK